MRLKTKVWLGVAGGLLLAALIPRPVVIAPRWRVSVVDGAGRAVSGGEVVESWIHYSLQKDESWESRQTNGEGVVEFPERSRIASVLHELVGAVSTVLDTGIHSGFGTDARIVVRTKRGAVVTRREAQRVRDGLESRVVLTDS